MPQPAIIPRPVEMHVGEGSLALTAGSGVFGPAEVTGLARALLGLSGAGGDGGKDVVLDLTTEPTLGEEGYRLHAGEQGVRVSAGTLTGLRWGLQTLRQLSDNGRVPYVEIVDRPRHPWRGSLLDVARWHKTTAFLYRYVDLLAMHKLNTLHLHLTDDQGWRFEVQAYPRLTEVGGFRSGSSVGHLSEGRTSDEPHGGFYTQRELRDLVAYAAERGVRIMPEIDAPGHMQAAIAAYPWLGNVPKRALPVRREWGISSHVLNVSDATVSFMRQVLDELVDVFPFEYVHIGGDEVPTDEWIDNPEALRRVEAEGLAGPEQLLSWWSRQLAAHLARHGRRVGVWDELVETGAPDGAAVFAWRGVDRVDIALREGYDVVAAPWEHTYLDFAESDDPDEPLAIGHGLPLEKVYAYEPPVGVLGLQGQVWSEYLPTTQLVEWRAFPRLAAIAEVGWSPAERDVEEFRRRLTEHLPRLDRLGVNYRPLSPR